MASPLPAVGDILAGVSVNALEDYLVVAGSGGTVTTGSAQAYIGQVMSFTDSEIMGIAACNAQGGSQGYFNPSPSPSPSPSPISGGSQGSQNMGYTGPTPSPTTNQ